MSHIQNAIAATEFLIVKKQIKSRLQCARRMQGVFWKTGKRLKLAGIKVRDTEGQPGVTVSVSPPQPGATINVSVVSSPQAVQHALSSHWGPIYEKKHCDPNAANTILRIYGKRHTELIKGFAECVLVQSYPKKAITLN